MIGSKYTYCSDCSSFLLFAETQSPHSRPYSLVWHLTEQQIDAAAMVRRLDQEAIEHLADCALCTRRVENTINVIRALRGVRNDFAADKQGKLGYPV